MLANWMLYCVAVGTLLACGALALERGLRALGRPTRWAWAAAMALALAIPAFVRLAPGPRAVPVASAVPAAPGVRRPAPPAAKTRVPALALSPALELGGWDPALRLAWGASSAALLLALGAMGAVLARRRRAWRAAEVDGVPVLVSRDTGPAVVGLLSSRIVLPAWSLAADGEARRLVLEHEMEHVRAGDPRLVAAALLVPLLLPWNPAAWWMLRRLRLAIEVDCDARVLRRRADVRAYGTALLEIGRRTARSPLPVAAFAEPVSSLERRIRIMTAPRARRPLLRAAGFAAVAATLVALACEAPQPTQPSGSQARPAKSALTPRNAVAAYFPEVAKQGTLPGDLLFFVISGEGDVLRAEWIRGEINRSEIQGLGDSRVRSRVAPFRGMLDRARVVRLAPGEAGPSETQVIWVQLRSSPNVESERSRAIREAIRRHYPPLLRDAGITARVPVSFRVDADGKARAVKVVEDGVQPAFVEAARAVVADLTFPRTAPGEEVVMVIVFAPERTPAPSAS
ncbi:MAG: M56 family metallopeptidase [Longimicrobiaceae bacterium]